ncbi:response regulator [Curvibacter fontanus]|jgi:two-component system cell cycle response regulator DivK
MATILVAEDNHTNRKLLVFILEHAGHLVLQADDGAAAIAAVRRRPPELIVMDVQMPGMDGITATGMLKADDTTAGIPVVALTAHAMKGDEEKLLAAGFQGYLAKPFRHDDLLAVVAAALLAA